MTSETSSDSPVWFVLNFIGLHSRDTAQKTVDKYNNANGCPRPLKVFAPTYVVKEEKDGEIRFRNANLTFHYTFVNGTLTQVKDLCSQPNGFSFLINRGGSDRYSIIDDHRMAAFQNIARAYKNCLPYYSIDEVDLQDGDLVEVVKGDFPGLIGTYMPKPRSNSGNIVLAIFNNVGTVAFNVRATDVRVLEFSRNSTRANEQIDAFVPSLLKALRIFDNNQPLPSALIAKIVTFCGRMEVVRMKNRKLDARLQILLYAANTIIGNTVQAADHLARFYNVNESVTNLWTKALIQLIQAIISGCKQHLSSTLGKLQPLEADSRAKQQLLEEYNHYLAPAF